MSLYLTVVKKFTGLGHGKFSMYTDLEGSQVSCNVSSLLGWLSLVVLIRQHGEGKEDFIICPCFIQETKWCTNFIGISNSSNAMQVWAATSSGALEVTYTHSEKNVCYLILSTYNNCVHFIISFFIHATTYLLSCSAMLFLYSWFIY